MKTLWMAAVLVLISHGATAQEVPRIVAAKGQAGHLELGGPAQRALKAFDPEFAVLEAKDFITSVQDMFLDSVAETPMAVIGDFNGDKIKDVIVMGKSGRSQLVLGVVSGANGYSVKEIAREPFIEPAQSFHPPISEDASVSDESEGEILRENGLFRYLTLTPAGSDIGTGKKARKAKLDGFQIETFFADSQAYFFTKDRFQQYKGR